MKRIIFLSLFLGASFVQAKTLYVDINNGNDNTSYAANSPSNPWASLGRAAWGSRSRSNGNSNQAARAGDVVIVRAGTYNTNSGTGERHIPIYNPVNSGRSGSPIVFRAEGDVYLTSTTDTRGEPIIGTVNRDFIVWDGFIIDENNINTKPDTGPVVIWSSDNVTLQNLTVIGITSSWNDNHNAIRIERSRNALIRNNTLSGTRNAGMNRNGSSIMLYYSNNITIEHNDISDSNGGIFIKGENGGPVIVRKNYIHDIDKEGIAIGVLGTSSEQYGGQIYQNIIRDSNAGITFIGYNSFSPANVDVVNNTIYNCSNGGLFLKPSTNGYRDIVFGNNIIVNNTRGIQAEDISDLSSMTFQNNLYYENSTHSRVGYSNYDFSSWQNAFSKDIVGSVSSDPAFSSTSGNTLTLSSNSPAINAGVDILNLQGRGTNAAINLGAYVTGTEVIGVMTGSEQSTAVDFEQYNIQSYGGASQDIDGTVEVQGGSVTLTGNTWKRIAFPYTITPNTMLELDFASSAEGEVQGIGFDVDNRPSYRWSFELYGTDLWGLRGAASYTGDGEVQHMVIPVGQYFTGDMQWLTLINDHDVEDPTAQSTFSNVRVYEANSETSVVQ